jgi:hypothetical protein
MAMVVLEQFARLTLFNTREAGAREPFLEVLPEQVVPVEGAQVQWQEGGTGTLGQQTLAAAAAAAVGVAQGLVLVGAAR